MPKHIEYSKFSDASLLSNPLAVALLKKWGEIYARTLAHFGGVCPVRLQAAPGKASSAMSELVEKVRSNLYSVTVTDTRVPLAVALPINPIGGF